MKAQVVKRILSSALAMTLLLGSSNVALASSGSSVLGNSATTTTVQAVEETVTEQVMQIVNESSSGSVSTIAEIPTTSSVAGVKSTVSGVYLATSVNGVAVTTGMTTIADSYGLAKNEKAYVRAYNFDGKRSTAAKAVIDSAAASMGAEVGPIINFEFGKMADGKFSLLPSDGASFNVKVGIPKSFAKEGKTYAIVCVRPGGAVSIIKDADNDPNTVTFPTTAGQAAYALICY